MAGLNTLLTCPSSSRQGMIHALAAIYREHGIVGLWRGSSAAVARVSVGSASQLSTFSSAKELVVDLQVRMFVLLLRFDHLNSRVMGGSGLTGGMLFPQSSIMCTHLSYDHTVQV